MSLTFRLFGAFLVTLVVTSSLRAQPVQSTIYSRPTIPSREVLDRLNLNLAWRGYISLDGRRDGILRTELDGKDLFVLTRFGQVVRLDAETGKVLWKTAVGKPYTLLPFFAANGRSVYVIGNVELFALDRETGFKKWEYKLPAAVSAAPIVDEQQIYIPTATTRLFAYYLPFVGVGSGRSGEGENAGDGGLYSLVYGGRDTNDLRPQPVWVEQTNINLTFRPLQTSESLFVISRSGQAIGLSKVPPLADNGGSNELFRLSTEGEISVPPGQYGNIAYVGSDDAAVYAVNMTNGKLRWRHTAGTAITRRPIALEKDVFVTSDREGMARIDRGSGDSLWKIPCGRKIQTTNGEADEFLAANDRFVYASDRAGRLLILDRKRGVRLSWLDTTAYRVKVVNEVTDRLYLAAHDGLIVCLHDRDQKTPIRHRRPLEEMNSPTMKLLEQKVTAAEGRPAPLREVLTQLRAKYKLKFVVSEVLQKANVQDKNVSTPAADGRTLKDYLQRTLTQVNATFQVIDDTILIVPGKPK